MVVFQTPIREEQTQTEMLVVRDLVQTINKIDKLYNTAKRGRYIVWLSLASDDYMFIFCECIITKKHPMQCKNYNSELDWGQFLKIK